PASGYFSRLRLIGQAGGTYLLCESPQGLVIIDQHAAHERVTFERLKASLSPGGGGHLASQPFLLPVRVELGPQAQRTLAAHAPLLPLLGFEVEPFGGDSYLVKSLPAPLVGADPAELLADLLDHLAGQEPFPATDGVIPAPLQDRLEEVWATLACHGSVRAGQPLAPPEARALLHALEGVGYRGHCPHGRPVLVELPFSELARRMKRR
ncbi:MAG: DNA mismatch repair protein MutL, partial [Deltaproteobacteria bacterium]|nr:DNA mismatch repair protein MutL [Deltaproteobacteria bacterium]